MTKYFICLFLDQKIRSFLLRHEQLKWTEATKPGMVAETNPNSCLWCGRVLRGERNSLPEGRGASSPQGGAAAPPAPPSADALCQCGELDEDIVEDLKMRFRVLRSLETEDRFLRRVLEESQAAQILKQMVVFEDQKIVTPLWREVEKSWISLHVRICQIEHQVAFPNRVMEAFGQDFQIEILTKALTYATTWLAASSHTTQLWGGVGKIGFTEWEPSFSQGEGGGGGGEGGGGFSSYDRGARRKSFPKPVAQDLSILPLAFAVSNRTLILDWLKETKDFVNLWKLSSEFFKELIAIYKILKSPTFNSVARFVVSQLRSDLFASWRTGRLSEAEEERAAASVIWLTIDSMEQKSRKLPLEEVFNSVLQDSGWSGSACWKWSSSGGGRGVGGGGDQSGGSSLGGGEDLFVRKRKRRRETRHEVRDETENLLAEVAALLKF